MSKEQPRCDKCDQLAVYIGPDVKLCNQHYEYARFIAGLKRKCYNALVANA